MWKHGTTNKYTWKAKIYDEPSQFGINEGRVSKLFVKEGQVEVYCYDRGLDHSNITEEELN